MTFAPLAAVLFEHEDVDTFLAGLVRILQGRGWRISGVLQSRGPADTDCHCADMDLTSIASGETFRISQPLGNGARGCRLHPGSLAMCSQALAHELAGNPDLLLLNRFGRGESEGRGFRDLIVAALDAGIPVLTAVRPTYGQAWADFGNGFSCDLPMHMDAVLSWAVAMKAIAAPACPAISAA